MMKSSLGSAATVALAGSTRRETRLQTTPPAARSARIRFAAIGLNHSHISGQVDTVIRGGGQLVSFFAKETDLAGAFAKRFPDAKLARSEREILDDPSIQLVVSAAVPSERAPLGIEAMRHGKDFMVDKPAATTLEQLADVRRVQAETKRLYSVLIERLESKSINKAGELVSAGAIGRRYGGVLCDLASHNIDAFLFLTGSTQADIVASQVGNVHHPQYPGLEDFGDVMLNGDGGGGYIRVDWLSPAGLTTYGDGRLTILGAEGYIELRKTVDIAGRPGGNHLFLVDQKGARYVDCSDVPLPYAERLVDDILNRTTTSDSQTRTFLAMELALKAEKQARRVTLPSR